MPQMGHFRPIQRGFAIPVIHRRRHRTRWVAAPLRVVAAEAAFLLSTSSKQGRLLLQSRLPVRRPVLIRAPGGSTPASLRSGQSFNPTIAAQLFQA